MFLPLIKSWFGATTNTSATAGCVTETRFALWASRKTVDLLTVTEIVGDTCCCANPASEIRSITTTVTENKANLDIQTMFLSNMTRSPPLEFHDFPVTSLYDFDPIFFRLSDKRAVHSTFCGCYDSQKVASIAAPRLCTRIVR